MKAVIHIGTQKTGTTLLQRWLYSNRDVLGQQGVYLSSRLGQPNNRSLSSYVCERIDSRDRGLGITTLNDKRESFIGFEEDFSREVQDAAKSHDAMIISSEHFHSDLRNESEVWHLRQICERLFESVTILVYFREPASLRKSVYSTYLRNDGKLSLDEYSTGIGPETYFYNAYAASQLWSRAFGMDAFVASVYDRGQFQGADIRRDFLTKLPFAVDSLALDFTMAAANERVSALEASALRSINSGLSFWPGAKSKRQTNVELKARLLELDVLDVGDIEDNLGSEIAERFTDVNQEFFDSFLPSGYFPKYEAPRVPTASLELHEACDVVEGVLDATLSVLGSRVLSDNEGARLHAIARRLQEGGSLDDARFLLKLALKSSPQNRAMRTRLREVSRRLREEDRT